MKSLIPPELEAYAETHSMPESEICRRLREETFRTMDCPQMCVGPLEGAFLKILARMVLAMRVLDIGTFTGYSALCFAEVLPPGGAVVTCDIDPVATALARRFFAESPVGSKIDLRLGPALETMSGLAGPFDVVFIDADKVNYVKYFQRAMDLLSDRGVIVADNVLWNGEVVRHPPPDATTAAIQEFNRVVRHDPRVDTVMLTVRDGIAVIVPKSRAR